MSDWTARIEEGFTTHHGSAVKIVPIAGIPAGGGDLLALNMELPDGSQVFLRLDRDGWEKLEMLALDAQRLINQIEARD